MNGESSEIFGSETLFLFSETDEFSNFVIKGLQEILKKQKLVKINKEDREERNFSARPDFPPQCGD